MTKEKTSSSISMAVIGILRESFKIPLRNRNISVSVALLLVIPSSTLFLCNNLILKPPLEYLITKSVTLNSTAVESPETLKLQGGIIDDVGIIILAEAIYLLATSTVSLAAGVTAIYAWAAAYSEKELTLGDLYRTVGRRWKRPLITWLYITLFKTGYLALLAVPIGFFAFVTKGSVPLVGLGLVVVIALMGLLLFQYLIVIWKLSFVISVVDEEVYGLDALRKAGEIIKGRKLQGFGLYFLLSLGAILITRVSVLQMTNIAHAEATRLAMGVMDIVLGSLYWLYVDAVSTVFYYECKKSHGEEVELQGSLGYSVVPTTAYVDGDVF